MTDIVKDYYEGPIIQKEGIQGAGLIWYLGKDHLSPSYDNSDQIALDAGMWREGASKRVLKLATLMGIGPGDKVLDFGSGIGGPGRDVQASTGCELYGINITYNQILSSLRLSRAFQPDNPLFTKQVNADGEDLPFRDNTFDDVYSINMFYHIPNSDQALTEIARVLRPGGTFGLDDWFLTDSTTPETARKLRFEWSSPEGFHNIENIKAFMDNHSLKLKEEVDFTKEAGDFLTEDRFGKTFDAHVQPVLIEAFPKIYQYPEYQPEHAQQAAQQLRSAILFMGDLYRNGQAVYKQLVAEKMSTL